MVATVINLNRFRKAKERMEAQRRAAENRAANGLTKAEREQTAEEQARHTRDLDGKKVE